MNESDHTPSSDTDTTAPASLAEQILAQRKAFESAVTLRVWNDPAFAEQLAQDPVAAINAAFGAELPAELEVHLHHETPNTLHLVLPPAIAPADHELTEDDLEQVAGGAVFVKVTATVSLSAAVTTTVAASIASAAINPTRRR